ncbi:MAG: hypothetical protein WCP86_10110, partial [bacterium]
ELYAPLSVQGPQQGSRDGNCLTPGCGIELLQRWLHGHNASREFQPTAPPRIHIHTPVEVMMHLVASGVEHPDLAVVANPPDLAGESRPLNTCLVSENMIKAHCGVDRAGMAALETCAASRTWY